MYFEYYIMGIILIPGLILAIIAQARVSSAFNAFSKVSTKQGQTAAEIARLLLDSAGLENVKVVKVSGNLTDHYNPKTKTVALSHKVYGSTSVAALGIAAHEVGHAVQYKDNYFPIKIRAALIPITNFASTMLWPLVFLGFIFGAGASTTSTFGMIFLWAGIVLFGAAALLNIVTLPVEFNASSRALRTLSHTQILTKEELVGAKKVLNAAALTYVAAMLIAVLNLLRFILVARNN